MAMRSPELVEFVPIGAIAQSGDAEPALRVMLSNLPGVPFRFQDRMFHFS